MTAYNAGGITPGTSSVTAITHGACPLDGYPLVEIDDIRVDAGGERVLIEGGWDHIIPLAHFTTGQRRIAAAHGFEVSAEAEQIARDVQ